MKTAILYMSKHGTSAKVAEKISGKLKIDQVQIMNLAEDRNPDISDVDLVILGGSIHAGMIQKRVKDFYNKNKDQLLQKNLGLFLCSMLKKEEKIQFQNAFPEDLREHAKAWMLPGGEFIFEKMNFLEKAMVKKVSGVSVNASEINEEKIEEFCRDLSR